MNEWIGISYCMNDEWMNGQSTRQSSNQQNIVWMNGESSIQSTKKLILNEFIKWMIPTKQNNILNTTL